VEADSWGLDHGTWSVLVHAFPEADVPVLQLSVNAQKPLEHHLELGAALAPLRERGVVIVGSGNVVHNLRLVDWSQPDLAFPWARDFDEEVREVMASSPADVLRVVRHEAYRLAVPTPDHFIPLLYVAGLASAAGRPAVPLVEGYAMGSLSMTAYAADDHAPAEVEPDPWASPHDGTPADASSIWAGLPSEPGERLGDEPLGAGLVDPRGRERSVLGLGVEQREQQVLGAD